MFDYNNSVPEDLLIRVLELSRIIIKNVDVVERFLRLLDWSVVDIRVPYSSIQDLENRLINIHEGNVGKDRWWDSVNFYLVTERYKFHFL